MILQPKIKNIFIVSFDSPSLKKRREKLLGDVRNLISKNEKFFHEDLKLNLYIPDSNKDIERYRNYKDYVDLERTSKKMSHTELSCSIEHLNAYRYISQNNDMPHYFSLILEDDAIITNDMVDNFGSILKEIHANNYTMVFLSECCNLRVKNTRNKSLSDRVFQVETSRSVCGYIVRKSSFIKELSQSKLIDVIDHHLNKVKRKEVKYGWVEPPVIKQGSESIYSSHQIRS